MSQRYRGPSGRFIQIVFSCCWSATQSAEKQNNVVEPPDAFLPLFSRTACEPYLADKDLYPDTGLVDGVMRIRRVDVAKLTPSSFDDFFRSQQKPVIVKNAASAIFGASGAASLRGEDLLKHPVANRKQLVTTTSARILLAGQGRKQNFRSLQDVFSSSDRGLLHLTDSFQNLENLDSNSDTEATRDLDSNSDTEATRDPETDMQKTMVSTGLRLVHHFYSKLLADSFLTNNTKWMPSNSGINVHLSNMGGLMPHSHGAAFHVALQGAKRWLLVDPEDLQRARIKPLQFEAWMRYGFGENVTYTSQQWFLEKESRSLAVPHYSFVLEEGDGLWIPDYFTHATADLCKHNVGASLVGPVVTGRDAMDCKDHAWRRLRGANKRNVMMVIALIGFIFYMLRPVFKHFRLHAKWVVLLFAITAYKILPASIEKPVKLHTVVLTQSLEMESSLALHALRLAVPKEQFRPLHEDLSVTEQDRVGGSFMMAIARNPCDAYLSLWEHEKVAGGGSDGESRNADDVQRFRDWVHSTSQAEIGNLSARFYDKYLESPDPHDFVGDRHVGDLVTRRNDTAAMFVVSELRNMDVNDLADCWIRVEWLEKDLVQCLHNFEGIGGGPVDWASVEQWAASILGSTSSGDAVREASGSCEMYFDDLTANFVRRVDAPLFLQLGYKHCCGSREMASEKSADA